MKDCADVGRRGLARDVVAREPFEGRALPLVQVADDARQALHPPELVFVVDADRGPEVVEERLRHGIRRHDERHPASLRDDRQRNRDRASLRRRSPSFDRREIHARHQGNHPVRLAEPQLTKHGLRLRRQHRDEHDVRRIQHALVARRDRNPLPEVRRQSRRLRAVPRRHDELQLRRPTAQPAHARRRDRPDPDHTDRQAAGQHFAKRRGASTASRPPNSTRSNDARR
mmetsp:Transcript_38817/g.124436  ORF Transcript_38817/g.124436 Transcript_38817/m.124436 type:complete len:228 (+) Transcript_38817:743-1426(+)